MDMSWVVVPWLQVGAAASKVSTLPAVRAAVGFLPKAFAASPPAGWLGSQVPAWMLCHVPCAMRCQLHEFFSHTTCLGTGCLGVVLDGRDVGTVLFPDAAVKLFVTASDQVGTP